MVEMMVCEHRIIKFYSNGVIINNVQSWFQFEIKIIVTKTRGNREIKKEYRGLNAREYLAEIKKYIFRQIMRIFPASYKTTEYSLSF